MKGKILNFKAEKGFGFILGEDNQKYFFHISTVSNPMDIEENYSVTFKTKEGNKGLSAINIVVETPLSGGKSKDKILKIKDLRIRASDIKEYNISKHKEDGSFKDEDEDGNYHYLLAEEPTDYYRPKIVGRLRNDTEINAGIIHRDFINITNNDLIDNLIDLYHVRRSNNYVNLVNEYSSFINFKHCTRYCYTLEIKTYTSGEKHLTFISHDEELNKKEVYKWLDYIDNELEKLI